MSVCRRRRGGGSPLEPAGRPGWAADFQHPQAGQHLCRQAAPWRQETDRGCSSLLLLLLRMLVLF